LSLEQWRRIDVTGRIEKHKVIAEVIRAHNCEVQAKSADKLVTRNGTLIPEGATFLDICVVVLANIYTLIQGAWQFTKTERDSNDMIVNRVKYVDVGSEAAGRAMSCSGYTARRFSNV
jgi:hypothetical protein